MKLRAWRYDRKFHAYEGSEMVAPFVSHDRLVYELPPCSTLIEPPVVEPGQAAVFMETTQTWIVVGDHRGERGWLNWKGEEVTILRLGEPSLWHLKRRESEPA